MRGISRPGHLKLKGGHTEPRGDTRKKADGAKTNEKLAGGASTTQKKE